MAAATSISGARDGDLREQLEDRDRELGLWERFPTAMALVQRTSEVFRAAKEGPVGGKAFVFPIVASYGHGKSTEKEDGAAPQEVPTDATMQIVELLAIVDKAPEAAPAEIFQVFTDKLALCPALMPVWKDVSTKDILATLDRMHDVAEYLQLEKKLCERVMQLHSAETLRGNSRALVADVTNDKYLGPVLTKAISSLGAGLRLSGLAYMLKRPGLGRITADLSYLVLQAAALEGAFGRASTMVLVPVSSTTDELLKEQICFLFGQGMVGRPLDRALMSKLLKVPEKSQMGQLSQDVLAALVLLGKNIEAHEMVEFAGLTHRGEVLTKCSGSFGLQVEPAYKCS